MDSAEFKGNKINKDFMIRSLIYLLSVMLFYSVYLNLNSVSDFFTDQFAPHEAVALDSGEEITQYLNRNSGYLKGVSLIFGTYSRSNEGDVIVSFKENDNVIYQWKIKANELNDDIYRSFDFDHPIRLDKENDYAISVTENYTGENAVAVYLTMGGRSLYSSNTGLIDNYIMCYRLKLTKTAGRKPAVSAVILIILAVLLGIFIYKVKLPAKRMADLLLFAFLTAIIFFAVGFEFLPKIKKEIEVKPYTENEATVTVYPEMAEIFTVRSVQNSFDSIEFYIMNEFHGICSVSLFDGDGKAYFDNYIIPDRYYVPANGKAVTAVKLDISESPMKVNVLPDGEYTLMIMNADPASDLVVKVAEEGSTDLNVTLKKKNFSGSILALIILFGLTGYVFVIFLLNEKKLLRVEEFYLMTAVLLTAVYFILFQPWHIPDSKVHFLATYRYSNWFLGNWGENAWLGRSCDADFYTGFAKNKNVDMTSIMNLLHNLPHFAHNKETVGMQKAMHMNYYSILNYLPQAIGIAIGRILGFGPAPTLYLGRFCIAAVFIGTCYHAIRMTPVGKSVFAAVALMPSTVMLSASYSYDAMSILVSMCFTASILRLYKEKSKRILIECMIWAFFLGGVKAGAFLLLLPLTFLLLRKKGENREIIKYIALIVAAGLVSVLLFDVIIPAGTHLFQFGKEGNGRMMASYAFTNPMGFIRLMLGAYIRDFDWLLLNMFGTYAAQGEQVIPMTVIFGMLIVWCICSVTEEDSLEFCSGDKYLFGAVIALSLYFTPMMLLSWTPIGSEVLEGLQGRYYIPLLPLALLILTKFKLRRHIDINDHEGEKAIRGKCYKVLCMFYCISVYYLIRLYMTR